jgi:hypothetical protein
MCCAVTTHPAPPGDTRKSAVADHQALCSGVLLAFCLHAGARRFYQLLELSETDLVSAVQAGLEARGARRQQRAVAAAAAAGGGAAGGGAAGGGAAEGGGAGRSFLRLSADDYRSLFLVHTALRPSGSAGAMQQCERLFVSAC